MRQQDARINYALDIVNLSKFFRRQTLAKGGYTTLKTTLFNFFSGHKPGQAILTTAIKDLTMRIPRGASVGVIGRNGSGKSSLLKLITGIYKPSAGTIKVNGRVAALIELGAGFHPDFTGRENVFLGAVMHGLSRPEIEERFDEIVKFAELEAVIDDPVRTYSSGMFMRLGFSLAIHTDPDVLLVDEVLAVGDAGFVAKCKDRVAALRKSGKTLMIVSHDLEAIERWCDEAIWLDKGVVKDRGQPRRVIDHYRAFIEQGEEAELVLEEKKAQLPSPESEDTKAAVLERWGSREIEILGARLLDRTEQPRMLFHDDDQVTVEFNYRVNEARSDIVFGIGIERADGLMVHGSNTHLERINVPKLNRHGKVLYRLNRLGLLDGSYRIDIAVHREDGYPYDYHKGILKFAVRCPYKMVGVVNPEHEWIFEAV